MDNIEDILRALAEDAPEDSGSKDESLAGRRAFFRA